MEFTELFGKWMLYKIEIINSSTSALGKQKCPHLYVKALEWL